MPRKGQSEEKIVFALRQVESGKEVADVCREIGGLTAGLLHVEEAVRGSRSERIARTASTSRGESEVEDSGGRPDFGQAHPAGGPIKKV